MFVLWFYSFETRTESVWDDSPIGERRRREIFPFQDVKNRYIVCICYTVHVFMATASSNHELSTDWTSEEEEMCTKFQSTAITQLSTAPIKNEINSEWFDMWMRKTSEVLAWRRQSRPIWKHKWSVFLLENKKSTTRDGLDDYANTKKKRTKTNQKKTYQLLVSRFLKHLDKKAVLQTIGYQHISKVPQCLLVEA